MSLSLGFFSFNSKLSLEHESFPLDFAILFWGGPSLDLLELSQAISEAIKSTVVTPDGFILLLPKTQLEDVYINLADNSGPLRISLDRLSGISNILIVGYLPDGTIGRVIKYAGKIPAPKRFVVNSLQQIKHSGLAEIVMKSEVVNPSPAGFVYSKFSKRKSNYFIRAENCLVETQYAQFLSFCALKHLSKWSKEHAGEFPSIIYIDTMGICSFVYCLSSLISTTKGKLYQPRVVSFHSYAGLNSADFSYRNDSFCVISASFQRLHQVVWQENGLKRPAKRLNRS